MHMIRLPVPTCNKHPQMDRWGRYQIIIKKSKVLQAQLQLTDELRLTSASR